MAVFSHPAFWAGLAPTPVRRIVHGVRARPAEDPERLARAARGDADAFRAIFRDHQNDVARLVMRMLGPRPDVDDVIQEVFFQVFRSLKDFQGKSKFSTWLHRVTVNVVLMHRRAQRSRPMLVEETPQDVQRDPDECLPDEEVARRERLRAFQRLLDRLPEKKRIVFVLHELEGLPPAEIARIVEAPVLTVRTRLFYARRELESMFADEPALRGVSKSLTREREAKVSAPPSKPRLTPVTPATARRTAEVTR